MGRRRWISFGAFAIQPGEFAKPALIVVGAAAFGARTRAGQCLAGFRARHADHDAAVGAARCRHGDLMVGAVIAVQLFVAGLPWLLVLGALGASVLMLWQAYHWFPHVAGRIDRFLDPASGDHYQVGLALKAVKSAAWFGSGPGEGRLKTQIPDAHSDFVFAVAAEEFGLIACLLLIGLFAFVVLRGLRRTELVSDRFALIAGAGLARAFRTAGDGQCRRQSLGAAGDRHDPSLHQLWRFRPLRDGDRHGHVFGPYPPPRRPWRAISWSLTMNRPVIITAGGTGGHMFPALALAAELERRGRTVALACDERGARYLPEETAWFKVSASSPSGSVGKRSSGILEAGHRPLAELVVAEAAKPAGGGRVRQLRLGAGGRGGGTASACRFWCMSKMPCSAARTA